MKLYTAAGLVTAQQKYKLNQIEKQRLSPHLVVIDELGCIPFSKVGVELLFQFCSARHDSC
ncbi:ATP-binding protein [Clostridium sp. CF011]|uniref:ATP-binding protein n=1 Tax=Clostridium sp. CF011 TaxID=2843318 RepID=UPI002DD43762|nr:ATP-binding protein [Clostridium sp. CF011]